MPSCCNEGSGLSPWAGAQDTRSCVELPPQAVIQTHLHAVQFTVPDTNLPSLLHSPLVQRPLNIISHYSSCLENTKQGQNRAASTQRRTAAALHHTELVPLLPHWTGRSQDRAPCPALAPHLGNSTGRPPLPGDPEPGLNPQPEQHRGNGLPAAVLLCSHHCTLGVRQI